MPLATDNEAPALVKYYGSTKYQRFTPVVRNNKEMSFAIPLFLDG